MWSDRVSNPGPLAYQPGALPTVLRGPAIDWESMLSYNLHVVIGKNTCLKFGGNNEWLCRIINFGFQSRLCSGTLVLTPALLNVVDLT